jgi:N utilization substance protein B
VRRTDQRRAAIFILYQHDVTGAPLAKLLEQDVALPDDSRSAQMRSALGEAVTGFTRELVEGVESVREELDELIEEQAIGWHVERIAPLERAILRVALYEIMYRPDVPDEVAIDEAIENAKLYCGAQAPAFVNGILGGVLRKIKRD